MRMWWKSWVTLVLCLLHLANGVDVDFGSSNRDNRKLFGGYRITPRFCKPTRRTPPDTASNTGPSICMFNHECSQRNGQVVGACMDGFLFGACCQLPAGSTGGLISEINEASMVHESELSATPSPAEIMHNGVSHITQTLLQPSVLPTAQDNAMVQIGGDAEQFMGSVSGVGVTHPASVETYVLNADSNIISAGDFHPPEQNDNNKNDNRRTTVKVEFSTVPYSEVPISIANGPAIYSTPSPYQRPMFRPKPSKPSDGDKYVLVPTISHKINPNKTQPMGVVNINQIIDQSTTTKKPTTAYNVLSASSTKKPLSTSRKPPSTSYIFSTTLKPRRTTTSLTTTTRRKSTTKPTRTTTKRIIYSSTPRPTAHSTYANSPTAFITTKQPPSTSYVYSSIPTKRPPSTVNTYIAGPGFSVTSAPTQYLSSSSTYPSPAPTVIVLGPVTESPVTEQSYPQSSVYSSTPRPPLYSVSPSRKPINSVTINNHVTQNIYSTSERPPPPQPTVLITPKPSISTSLMPNIDYNTASVEAETSGDELSNFPPVRNPNLNMSNPVISDDDITTPAFVEDDALNDKVESFVNKIIQGLQEPFEGLKDVVYNRNKTSSNTTKKPLKKQGTTTKRPTTVRTTKRPSTRRTTTTRRPTVTTKKPKSTKRPATTTTTESFIEEDDNNTLPEGEQYRDQCGIRPLLKSGRIVGGKGATFGEFPWQVLVRESTWLGLFTKNKCGGVLISNRYVMTAAHCQPGFLASLVAVFGEFDISGDLESRRPLTRNVKRVIVHRKYDAATFENDLALLELESPVKFDAHIIPICLPRDGEDFTGRMATVTGWGRLKYGGGVPSVLQEVQVPIMENHVCQEMFRTAGHSKVILDSFLCAGYANGQKDSCEGDSGGPLVLQRPDGRYQLAGTVSHGIKCAAPYLPGVYMRTTFYKPWIEAITGLQSN